MFERKIYDEMLKWKREYAPKYALFLKGASLSGGSRLDDKTKIMFLAFERGLRIIPDE